MPARLADLLRADCWQRHPHEDPVRLPGVLRFVADALLLVNAHGTVDDLNPAAEALLGTTHAEAAGRPVQDVCPLVDGLTGVRHHPITADVVAIGRAVCAEVELRLGTGTDAPEVDAAAIPVAAPEGVITGALLVVRSIADLRRLEHDAREAVQARERLGRAVVTATHDLNNALAPVTLVISGFREDGTADVTQLDTIVNSLERAIDTVRQLRGSLLSRETALPPVDLSAFVRGVATAVRQSWPEHVELRVLDPDPGQPIAVDPMPIHAVLLRLAQRARDAMAGHGRMTLAAYASEGRVTFTVQDTGASLEARPLQGVEIVWPAPVTETGGAAVVRALLGNGLPHGSLARLDSIPGRGTRVTLEVPTASRPETRHPAHAPVAFEGHGRVVLCVDDEPAVREAMAASLARLGLVPLPAPDAIYALQLARDCGPRIAAVITDVNMPDIEGLQLAAELGAVLPGVPVVLSTGLVDDRVRTAVSTGRVAALLEKPFSAQSLAACLAAIMGTGRDALTPANAPEEESYR